MPGVEYYSPRKAPDSKEPEIRDLGFYVERELKEIAQALSNFTSLRLEPQSVAPARPREGQLAYADGTNWSPNGAGGGIYVYTGNSYGWQRATDDIFILESSSTFPFVIRSSVTAGWTAFFDNFNGDPNSNIVFTYRMVDSAGNVESTGQIVNILLDDTNGSEDSEFRFYLMVAGTLTAGPRILGSGIAFPTTQVSSADPNVLDDYEEGSWTSTVTAFSGSFTTVSGGGSYTKVGNRVLWDLEVVDTTNGTAGGFIMATLPFTNGSHPAASYGQETALIGFGLASQTPASDTKVYFLKYDATYPGADGRTFRLGGHYHI